LQDEWAAEVDRYMDLNFKNTMAKLIVALRDARSLPDELEQMLAQSVATRNFLVHNFFRDRNELWLTEAGRDMMIAELVSARETFQRADRCLENEMK
jgi:hypothetical protein